jgi:hypothetical protein
MSENQLLDVTPSRYGEYFSPDGIHPNHTDSYCFMCGRILDKDKRIVWQLDAFIQCRAAFERLRNFFSVREAVVFGVGSRNFRIVSCDNHKHLLELLSELTQDGTVDGRKICAVLNSEISQEKYHDLVSEAAYKLYTDRQDRRDIHNWCDAWTQLVRQHGHAPSPIERRNQAANLAEERRGEYQMQDWVDAEKLVREKYSLKPIFSSKMSRQ